MHLSEAAVADDRQHLSSADGYSQTKFASEVLVQRCTARAPVGQRINMVKPGIIIGTATEGISNTDDFIWRLAAGACEAGVFIDGEQNTLVCLSGADQVAQRIIQSCLGASGNGDNPPTVVKMTQGITAAEFWNAVSDGTGITLRAIDTDKWFRIVNANVSRAGSSHLLWPVMEWVEQRRGRIGDRQLYKCAAGSCSGHCFEPRVGQLAGESSLQCGRNEGTREKTLQALRKSVEYLSSIDFLHRKFGMESAMTNVFSRSGVVT